MTRCPGCNAELTGQARFCPSCGRALGAAPDAPGGEGWRSDEALTTPARPGALPPLGRPGVTPPPATAQGRPGATPPPASTHARGASSLHATTPAGRFPPGTVLLERYRIVDLLGRGGMGEVYRADDLKLDQGVALKFLPTELAGDPERLDALYREVRIARQVSHANVCRLYDLGELDGLPFISMEYIAGENLASLLRRIGRLPGERAVELARQICAGLAAAHERGVLHRDLKPANVMIDGDGRARIADFGLSGLAQDIHGWDIRSGTPAYMAPEQLAGTEVTPRSDLYSLGLVLYEMFTGKPAFRAESYAELVRMQSEETPASPSSLLADIDPAVERVILRCLEKDPRERPASALAVAAALPGGDPLAAALAAGETPSPELVASAGEEGTIGPRQGWLTLAGLAACLALLSLASAHSLHRRVPLDKPVAYLTEHAREIAGRLGYPDPPHDSVSAFGVERELIAYAGEKDRSPSRWDWMRGGRPAAIYYWYRQSPRELVPVSIEGRVTPTEPAEILSGMLTVVTDPLGRLLEFRAVPPQLEDSLAAVVPSAAPATAGAAPSTAPTAVAPVGEAESAAAPVWAALFAAAELDPAAFTPVEPRWVPLYESDSRAAWAGAFPGRPAFPLRIEAAAHRGKATFFKIIGPWTRAERQAAYAPGRSLRAATYLNLGLFLIGLLSAGLLARRNMRLGRGDRRGAMRLAIAFIGLSMLEWLFSTDHAASILAEWGLLTDGVALALFKGLLAWVLYIALEPLVRRRWPDLIISWARLLSGRWRDPMVGRDILRGTAIGVGMAVLGLLGLVLPRWLGHPPLEPERVSMDSLMGLRYMMGILVNSAQTATLNSIFFLLLPLGLLVLLRKEWAAFALSIAAITAIVALATEDHAVGLALGLGQVALWFLVARRLGILTLFAAFFAMLVVSSIPLNLLPATWYSGPAQLALALLVLIAAGGFRIALGKRATLR